MKSRYFHPDRVNHVVSRLTPWFMGMVSVLFALVPFHAFLVIVAGAAWGHQLLFASWKEVLELLIITGVGIQAILQRDGAWLNRGANRALLIALAFGLLASCVGEGFGISWLAGVKITVLPILLFIFIQPLAKHFTDRRLLQVILIPAVVVAVLALLQFIFMPVAWLTSLGYNAQTILPFQGVHPGFNYARAFSTLGGPNQLGAFLILPAVWLLARSLSEIHRRQRLIAMLGFGIVASGLALSFSRSALLGLAAGLVMVVTLYLPTRWRWVILGLAAIAAWLGWLLVLDVVQSATNTALSSYFLRGTLSTTGIIGGDSGHIQAVMEGVRLVFMRPFGLGLGSAGPATFYRAQPFLTENWWIQMALELGIPGLLALISGWILIGKHWLTHLDTMDQILFAAFFGLAVSGLFLHTFADSTLAITSFGLAGIIYGRHWSSRGRSEG